MSPRSMPELARLTPSSNGRGNRR
ncbi:MAG: hypothetical protein QOH33_2329, partial [Paraburkholderia sp.]|nr:hypothetical protein [Paraburkholderia sp.]